VRGGVRIGGKGKEGPPRPLCIGPQFVDPTLLTTELCNGLSDIVRQPPQLVSS
jgi:hypothetical protein